MARWDRPKLFIITRSKEAEFVLDGCKHSQNAGGPSNDIGGCMEGKAGHYCGHCFTHPYS